MSRSLDLLAHLLLGDGDADEVLAIREVIDEGHEELRPVLGLAFCFKLFELRAFGVLGCPGQSDVFS